MGFREIEQAKCAIILAADNKHCWYFVRSNVPDIISWVSVYQIILVEKEKLKVCDLESWFWQLSEF